jgi:hypothetical protein
MRFATLTILPSARSSSSASEIHIPASTNQRLETKSPDPAEARVMVHDFIHETSAEDLNIVSKSIVAAYNPAYSTTGYSSIASDTKKMPVSAPDKVDFTLSFCSGCRWCPNSRGRCRH